MSSSLCYYRALRTWVGIFLLCLLSGPEFHSLGSWQKTPNWLPHPCLVFLQTVLHTAAEGHLTKLQPTSTPAMAPLAYRMMPRNLGIAAKGLLNLALACFVSLLHYHSPLHLHLLILHLALIAGVALTCQLLRTSVPLSLLISWLGLSCLPNPMVNLANVFEVSFNDSSFMQHGLLLGMTAFY